jgi:hypothetical protein
MQRVGRLGQVGRQYLEVLHKIVLHPQGFGQALLSRAALIRPAGKFQTDH